MAAICSALKADCDSPMMNVIGSPGRRWPSTKTVSATTNTTGIAARSRPTMYPATAPVKRVRGLVGGVTAEGQLFEDKAPQTVAALWSRLPILDRTIHTRWSGDAW